MLALAGVTDGRAPPDARPRRTTPSQTARGTAQDQRKRTSGARRKRSLRASGVREPVPRRSCWLTPCWCFRPASDGPGALNASLEAARLLKTPPTRRRPAHQQTAHIVRSACPGAPPSWACETTQSLAQVHVSRTRAHWPRAPSRRRQETRIGDCRGRPGFEPVKLSTPSCQHGSIRQPAYVDSYCNADNGEHDHVDPYSVCPKKHSCLQG